MKEIRRFRPGDETALSALIRRCFLEINIQDYSLEALQFWADLYTPEHVREIAEKGHMYVMEEDGALLGCCTILRETEKATPDEGESAVSKISAKDVYVEALYVLPDRAKEGNATQLLAVCEKDPAFADAEKIWVDSSITARPFYERRGYLHETGEPVCIENDRYIMYKKT